MKKLAVGAVVAALVVTMGAGSVFAMGGHHSGWRNVNASTTTSTGYRYVDANGDGVCDWYGTGHSCGMGFVDADGDGVCDYCGNGYGAGYGYVDANGDGVCDNYGTGSCYGAGCGYGYVDANGDGVCDYYGTGVGGGHHGGCAR